MPLKPITAMRKDKSTGKSATMQHRHMAFIAKVIATSGERAEDKRRWASYFAYDLAKANPAFDRARFFSAAGIDDPYITEAAYPKSRAVFNDDENKWRGITPSGTETRLLYNTEREAIDAAKRW